MDSEAQYMKMTRTPVPRLIVALSIPTILSMLVTNVYNVVDTAFVGKLGTSASGAVGIVFGFMTIIQAVGFLFGQGCGSIISRKLGKFDNAGASEFASTGFFLSLFLGTVASILCFFFIEPLVMLLGSTPTIAPYAIKYITYILITAPFMAAGFTLNNILRYEGKAFYGMIALFAGAILNIGGDALFMFGFNMGISGAGLSTAISQVVSFVCLLIPFIRKKTQCVLSFDHIRFRMNYITDIIATGFPSLLRQGLNSVATILLNYLSGGFGDGAVAAMSIVSRVYFFIFAIALGVGQGFQPVSGFNYGAGKFSRVRNAFKFTVSLSTLIIVIAGTGVLIFAPQIIYIFREDPEVVMYGTRALRLQSVTGMVMPFTMATEMLLQSTGKKISASVLSALRSGVIFIPALAVLAKLRGMAGIQEAQPLAFLLSVFPTALFVYYFFRDLPAADREDAKAVGVHSGNGSSAGNIK
ncbi:MAG: MATE family efflux transporter [Clostridiales bacterium]|nr:MATE family efflux transporter [Clostridiales bacterium]